MAKSKQHSDFAVRLAEAMTQRGWVGRGRAERLAEVLREGGLEKATSQLVSTWLRGDRMPRGAYADRLPGLLRVPAGYLSGADVPKDRPRLTQAERSALHERAGPGGDSAPRAHGGDAASSSVGLVREVLSPHQEETAAMAANALQRALREVQNNLHGAQDRLAMARALERFARELRTELHFSDVAFDLLEAANRLREAAQQGTT